MTEQERLEKISYAAYGIIDCIHEYYQGIEKRNLSMMHSGAVATARWAKMLIDLLPEELRGKRESELEVINEAYYKYRPEGNT